MNLLEQTGQLNPKFIAPVGGHKALQDDPLPCGKLVHFESYLVIAFVGDPNNALPDQIAALEQGVVDTYNGLNGINSISCDEQFRKLVGATLDGNATLGRRVLVGPVGFAIPTHAPARKPTKKHSD